MLRSAACESPICPASACTTIAVTWWPDDVVQLAGQAGALLEPAALPRRVLGLVRQLASR